METIQMTLDVAHCIRIQNPVSHSKVALCRTLLRAVGHRHIVRRSNSHHFKTEPYKWRLCFERPSLNAI